MAKKKQGKRWQRVLKRIFLTLLLLVVLAGAAFYGYMQLKSEYTVTYDSYNASIGTISNSLSFTGTLQLIDSSMYTAQAATSVRTIYVNEGDKVKKGDRLIRLANGESYSADFDGTVNRVFVAKNDDVNPGTQLVQVADFDHMSISFRVDEYDISDVAVGMPCKVTTTATEDVFDSTIASIDYISASTGNVAYYTAKSYVDVTNGVYPGMQATVSITQEEADNVVVLKMDALSFDRMNSAFVYKMKEDGEMEECPVTVGVSNGNYVEIVSGVKDGETVYAIAKQTTTNPWAAMMSGAFGSTRVNTQRQNRNNGSGNYGGNWNGGNAPGGMPGGGAR